jgi:type IV pilus assembly protein PilY1
MKPNFLVRSVVWTTFAAFSSSYVGAAAVDIANVPLVSTSTKVVRPNVFFVLDDSTSMTWEYMPDDVNNDNSKNCFKNFGYNKVYYNPNQTYDAPLTSTGASMAASNYASAETDGFLTSGANVVLSTSFKAYSGDTVQAAYYYEYTGGGAYSATNPPGTCVANANYTKRLMSTMTAAQRQNFANWYSYYRTRVNMMKSAVGRAFIGVDDKFRVGFTTINEKGTASARFLDMAKFDATQKGNWYTKLYNLSVPTSPVNYTPLRGALSKAGRYYAGTLVTGGTDPVQYSCQKNFTILTTDGYWNTRSEDSSYGPRTKDNAALVGDQDGVIATSPRPMYESGAYTNTLADVARYFYRTDLRIGAGLGGTNDLGVRTLVADNIKDSSGNDLPDGHQHMKTITLGLGLNGTLSFPADEAALLAGTKNWPDPQTSNTSDGGLPERLDDLWHAAVNGDGVYLSAGDAEDVVDALRGALATIQDRDLSGAAAATSSLEPVAGDNFAYVARYTTAKWHGDLQAYTIDLGTGALSPTVVWNAQTPLDAKADYSTDTRNIYTWNGTSRVNFTLANVTASNFESSGTNPNGALSQYAGWNATQRTNATPANMIAFLRGQNQFELQTDATHTDLNKRLFRDRLHVMGDIVDSSPVYVRKAPFKYADTGYASFAGAQLTRAGTVYVGANDGMLHAFDADTGAERWAYIPRILHPTLYKLADTNYAANHRYYVNGSLSVGDVYDGTNWRTILVAGLAGGGKGYFALDVTDPVNPTVLWEFTNANLGNTFGNPVITKRASDGTWVAVFASGYNNDTGGGDGRGRLFMVNAVTGALLGTVQTSAGTDPNQSGLAKLTGWVLDTLVDNSTQYFYGGDLAGNLWRFDINALAVQKMGQTSATVGAQPITTRPEVARVRDASGNYHRVVYVGTGRYLGAADMTGASTSEVNRQALYAVKDAGTDLGILTSAGADLVPQTLNAAVSPRTIPSPQAVDWTTKRGWYVTIPLGERITIDPRLQLGTIAVVSNKPVDEYCSTGGSSWLYALDYRSGGAVTGQAGNQVGFLVDAYAIATGVTIVRLPGDNGHASSVQALINKPDGTTTKQVPIDSAGGGSVRRVGYREIN